MHLVLVLACLVSLGLGMEIYRDRIPNGHGVPNMCVGIDGGNIWETVGHYNPVHHTHDKNPFGLAFAAAGHMWTVALCQQDSDRDGRTNGAELGDPNCVWAPGKNAEKVASGHPGICEPIGSAACSHSNFHCGCHGHSCIG